MPDENKQEAVATKDKPEARVDAAPVAKAENKEKGTASPKSEAKASDEKRGHTADTEKVEAKASEGSESKTGESKGKADFKFIQMRKQLKEAKESKPSSDELAKRLADAEKRLAELSESRKSESKSDEDDVSSFLENPRKFLEDRDNKVVERVLQAIEQSKREEALYYSASEAEKWLLTRSHIGDPAFAEDVRAGFEKFRHLAEAGDPMSAAKLAYLDVCSHRGVEPDLGFAKKDTSATGSIGVRPSSADTLGPATKTDKQWRAYVEAVRPDSPEYRSRLNEWLKAQSEGRA